MDESPNLRLIDILSPPGIPKIYEAFTKYLAEKQALESLDFWMDVSEFQVSGNLEDAVCIVSKYLKEGSKSEINIDCEQREAVLEQFKQNMKPSDIDKTLFNELQSSIFTLMEADSWRQFLLSDEYILARGIRKARSKDLKDKGSKKSIFQGRKKGKLFDSSRSPRAPDHCDDLKGLGHESDSGPAKTPPEGKTESSPDPTHRKRRSQPRHKKEDFSLWDILPSTFSVGNSPNTSPQTVLRLNQKKVVIPDHEVIAEMNRIQQELVDTSSVTDVISNPNVEH